MLSNPDFMPECKLEFVPVFANGIVLNALRVVAQRLFAAEAGAYF
jgi:hypothetical protein